VLGSLPRSELYRLYRESSVLVFPSICDGFGMVVTEALAHGLPVITTDQVGAADLIVDGVNGWIVRAGDAEALRERMAHCLEQPEALRSMREAAERTGFKHSWKAYRKRLVRTICDYFGEPAPEA
jgi:glycosyltransferase involved in cell wall biosynthesis